ncbi:triggering receptor expressed on myeloid cells 1 isoform X2 [Ailuropoda melanoleuca]|uniref:triggering receptor expressed on myeloid cells 1 isoform X2 n=1 Tax=Ailuropoda melanoleuca TaxID=9646 RepID=UPI001493FC40|nr:triggering receptor expressed on myeloid cells 1 isoform X2 [Ailuropoda melanoleuca]
MRNARLRGLLWMLFISELQAATKPHEEKYVLAAGETLNVQCPFTIWKYANSRKAWQKLMDRGEPLTLAFTQGVSGNPSQVQMGRYFLEDIPTEAILNVQMTNLQVEDSGLYQCVIYHPPKDPVILSPLVRLVVIKGPLGSTVSDKNPTQNLAQISTLPPTTTKAQSTVLNSPRTVTQLLPKSTADISSPGFGVNITNETDFTSYGFRHFLAQANGFIVHYRNFLKDPSTLPWKESRDSLHPKNL